MSTYVRVISVAPEGAAAGAVRAADAIISVNGQSVATHETATTLLKAAAGDVALVIVRAGRRRRRRSRRRTPPRAPG